MDDGDFQRTKEAPIGDAFEIVSEHGYGLKQIRLFIKHPEAVRSATVAQMIPSFVDAIAKKFTPHARRQLKMLYVAFLSKSPADYESYLSELQPTLIDAFDRALELQRTIDVVGHGTTAGLSFLFKGLYFENDKSLKNQSIAKAIWYWDKVLESTDAQPQLLDGYLLHRIHVWRCIALYNKVDKAMRVECVEQRQLRDTFLRANILAHTRALHKILKSDCAPVFHLVLFAAVLGDIRAADDAWAMIEKIARRPVGEYFMVRLKNFISEPIVERVLPHILLRGQLLQLSVKVGNN